MTFSMLPTRMLCGWRSVCFVVLAPNARSRKKQENAHSTMRLLVFRLGVVKSMKQRDTHSDQNLIVVLRAGMVVCYDSRADMALVVLYECARTQNVSKITRDV